MDPRLGKSLDSIARPDRQDMNLMAQIGQTTGLFGDLRLDTTPCLEWHRLKIRGNKANIHTQ